MLENILRKMADDDCSLTDMVIETGMPAAWIASRLLALGAEAGAGSPSTGSQPAPRRRRRAVGA